MQVVKYEIGGQFKVHQDSSAFHPRLLTVLIYLQAPYEGGETWFPYANENGASCSEGIELPSNIELNEAITDALKRSENKLTMGGFKAKPIEGSALIFFNHVDSNSGVDSSAVHAGMPVLDGEKWIANFWVDNDLETMKAYLNDETS